MRVALFCIVAERTKQIHATYKSMAYCSLRNEMERNEMERNEMERNEMERNEMEICSLRNGNL